MADDIAISVKNLTKTYRIFGHPGDRIKQALTLGRVRFHREFTALQDVSFEIKKGETVGIVGRNGSGKSTLLQLICGILKPTSGTVQVNGRVSALLELGAGFNPEFTGRENVYFQGAIMGFSEEEMDARIDDIAAFANIGEFIDQPVRTYSSGMFVRLAFAAAISAEPDILIVDEALSVGDESFQRKCFSHIQAIRSQGGTILIVSHSAAAVVELCGRAFLLDNGELLAIGKPKTVVDHYHKLLYAPPDKKSAIVDEIRQDDGKADGQTSFYLPAKPAGADFDPELIPHSVVSYEPCGAVIRNPRILDEKGREVNVLERGGHYIFCYDVQFEEEARHVRFSMLIKTKTGFELGGLSSHLVGTGAPKVKKGAHVTVRLPFHCRLLPGLYFLNSGVLGKVKYEEIFLHRVIDILAFRVPLEASLFAGGVVDFSTQDNPSAELRQ